MQQHLPPARPTMTPNRLESTSGGNKETQTTQSGDGLPDDLDFKGTKLSIAIRDKYTEYYLGEEGGDLIWAAVYKANQVVDERLHITREYVKTSESSVDHVNKVVTDILSNESTYDLVLVDQFYGCAKALDGAFANIKDEQYSKYLDLEKDYWYSDYIEQSDAQRGYSLLPRRRCFTDNHFVDILHLLQLGSL